MTTTPIQETRGELKINGRVMITHGMITHKPSEKCSICDEVRETFQKDLRSGKVEKLVGKIDPKIKKELLTTPIQETRVVNNTWQNELDGFIHKLCELTKTELSGIFYEELERFVGHLLENQETTFNSLLQRKERETIEKCLEVVWMRMDNYLEVLDFASSMKKGKK
jgi:hypothetical protein